MSSLPPDIALAETDGRIVVHRADCPTVRTLAALGLPVATLFGISEPGDDATILDLDRHSCLDE